MDKRRPGKRNTVV